MAVISEPQPSVLADRSRRSERLGLAGLIALLTGAAVFYLIEGAQLSFYVDEWDFMLHRRGHSLATFLDPQNGHLVAIPVFIYKLLFNVFGVGSFAPYRIAALIISLTCASLVFALVRRRLGDGLALIATAVVLFLGPAWEPIFATVGMIALMSLAAGLGLLLALERGSRRGDLVAGALLMISLASFSYGPAFAIAAAVQVLLQPDRGRRIWLVIVPSAVYLLWLLGYGHSSIIASDIPAAPRAMADSLGVDAVSITGLYRPAGIGGGPEFEMGYVAPAAVLVIALIAVALRAPSRRTPRVYSRLALAVTFWLEVALVLGPGRSTSSSRYVYPGVVFLLLALAEIGSGWRLSSRRLAVLAAATALLIGFVQIPNLDQGATALDNLGRFDRAELAALELARGVAVPSFQPEPLPDSQLGHHYLEHISAGSYFSAIKAFGSPAYTAQQLRHAEAGPRAAADEVLARAMGLAPTPAPASVEAPGSCRPLRESPAGVAVPPNGFVIVPRQASVLTLRLRRFGDDFGPGAVVLSPIPGGSASAVRIHPDAASSVPWHVLVTGISAPVRICALAV